MSSMTCSSASSRGLRLVCGCRQIYIRYLEALWIHGRGRKSSITPRQKGACRITLSQILLAVQTKKYLICRIFSYTDVLTGFEVIGDPFPPWNRLRLSEKQTLATRFCSDWYCCTACGVRWHESNKIL